MIVPVKKIAVTSLIVEQLQDLVKSRQLEPGDKLPSERELCENFGASRTAVREALSGLISKGIFERRSGGIYVCHFSSDLMKEPMELLIATKRISVDHILEARSILEIENAGLAAIRATEEEIVRMYQCVADIEISNLPETIIRQRATEFHELITQATHNPILIDLFKIMYDNFQSEPRSLDTLLKSAITHRKIYEFIKNRDAQGARREMRKHLSIVRHTL